MNDARIRVQQGSIDHRKMYADTRIECTGAVNSNLLELKRRVNSTLQDMLTVTTNLESARTRLERKQGDAVSTYSHTLSNPCQNSMRSCDMGVRGETHRIWVSGPYDAGFRLYDPDPGPI